MMSPCVLKICILVLGVIALSHGAGHYYKKDYSLVPPYFGSWRPYGSCVVVPSNVRLTSDQRSQKGGIYSTVPFPYPAWEVHLTFRVHGSTGSMFGDGFAFWYTRETLTPGDALGAAAKFTGLGVFFDTYSNHNGDHNHEHPFISAMVSNGEVEYDHDRDGTHTQLGGCTSKFRNKDHDVAVAIRYTGAKLKVSMDTENHGEWQDCFVVDDVTLPSGLHFGLSAATGDLTDTHDIAAMKVFELTPEVQKDFVNVVPKAAHAEEDRAHIADPPRSFFWTFVWYLFLICLLLAIVFCGYLYWESKQRRSKRFY